METLPQTPDLLEIYSDKVVTIFGMTGPLTVLAGMCPKDLNDPEISVESKNEFVAKAANEAGMEIDPEHEELFTEIVERSGLEKMFTVATAPDKPPKQAKEPEKPVQASTTPERPAHAASRLHEREPRPTALPDHDPHQAAAKITKVSSALQEAARQHIAQVYEHVEAQEATSDEHAPNKTVRDTVSIGPKDRIGRPEAALPSPLPGPVAVHNEATPIATAETVGDDARTAAINEILHGDELPVTAADSEALEDTAPLELPMVVASVEDLEIPVVPAEQPIVTDESAKQPIEIYDDFVAALQALGSALDSELPDDPTEPAEPIGRTDSEPAAADNPEASLQSAIITLVAEKLTDIEPEAKAEALPIVQDVVIAIGELRQTDIVAAEPEAVAAMEQKCEDLVKELFEALHIDYSESDVSTFVHALLRAGLPAATQTTVYAPAADLEHDGTHEAKIHWKQAAFGLVTEIEHDLERLLGSLVLLRAFRQSA